MLGGKHARTPHRGTKQWDSKDLGDSLPHKSHWLKLVTWSHLTARSLGNVVFLSAQEGEENQMRVAQVSQPQAPKFLIISVAKRRKGNFCDRILQVLHPAVSLLCLI